MASETTSPAARGGRLLSSVRRPAEGSVERYLSLPYHLTIVRDGEEKGKPWAASVEELPGCTSRGRTSDEALNGLEAAMQSWIATAIKEGRDVPEPKAATSHSGRLLLRMPRTLHAELTRVSEREGVSLNQFITDALAGAVAWRSGQTAAAPSARSESTKSKSISQTPGAEGLTTEHAAEHAASGRQPRRFSANLVSAALAANFIIVGVAGVVAIIVLIAAWL
jgi:antitoxin HicB